MQYNLSTGPKYYLFDAGFEEPSPNLMNTLDSLGLTNKQKHFRITGIIISHVYKRFGLQHFIDNYDFASFSLFTTNNIKEHQLDTGEQVKFGAFICLNNISNTPFCLLCSSSYPITQYKIEKCTNDIKKALSEDVFEKLDKSLPIVMQISGYPQNIFLSGNVPVDPMILNQYLFSVFQVPHHMQKPKLTAKVHICFPSQETMENAAKLMALYNYRHILGAEINLLDDEHPLYETAKSFKSYFMKKESSSENKFEKGFVKMLITHERSPNDPDDCYKMDNPQILWYEIERSNGEVFSEKAIKAVEEERKRQLDQILFICECVEWAYYYKEISAVIYTVSAGDNYNKIALQAIIGIMIACKRKKIPCRFAFTNSGWLKYMGGLMPKIVRDYVTDNTKIWFLNDVRDPDTGLASKSFFTVNVNSTSPAEDDSNENQCAVITVDTASKVEVKGMNVFNLESIRNEEDYRYTESYASVPLNITIAKYQCALEHSNTITKNKYVLGQYLQYIGYPNFVEPIQVKRVMECVIGELLVSQMINFQKDHLEYFEVIPELLSCKTGGQSNFALNNTKTGAIAATVIVYLKDSPIALSGKKLKSASFKVTNAKAHDLKIVLHLLFMDNSSPFQFDLVKDLDLDVRRSIGITLEEFVTMTGTAWNSIKHLTVEKILHVLFKENFIIFIAKNIPLFIYTKLNVCNIKYYLSYIRLGEENKIVEAHIHTMEAPTHKSKNSTGIFESGSIVFDIESLSLHLILENSVQIEGRGKINGHEVEFSTCPSSYLPQDLDVKFSDSFTIQKTINTLNLKVDYSAIEQHIESKHLNDYDDIHLVFSQVISHSAMLKLMFLMIRNDSISSECSIPSQLSDFVKAKYYTVLHFPSSANTHSELTVSKRAIFFLDTPLTNMSLNCSLYSENERKSTVNILPFYDGVSKFRDGKEIFKVIEALYDEAGCTLVKSMPLIAQNLNQITLKSLQFCFLDQKVDSSKLELLIKKIELLSAPCLTLHNTILKFVYSTQNNFSFECQGKLTLQLNIHEKIYKYSFKGELILPVKNNKGILSFSNCNNLTLENLIEAFKWAPDKVKSMPILSSALAAVVKKVHIEFNSLSSTNTLEISSLCVMLYLQELDIGILQLNHIHLEIKIMKHEDEQIIYFKLQALIGEKLFVELEYDPDDHLLHGLVTVCDFKAVNAIDALAELQLNNLDSSLQSFSNMKTILQDCFMSVFKSSKNMQKEGVGLVASMKLNICVPSKNYKKYSLKYLKLQVKDCLCIQNCLFDIIEFNYSKISPSSSEAHLMAVLRVKSSKESMKITFDLTNTNDKPTVLLATIKPNDKNNSISLHSIFDLVSCKEPGLPKVDLPPIFELLIVDGSVSLTLSPFQVCKCDVAAIIPKWQIFNDPDFKLQDIKIRAIWESGLKIPSLIFDNCTLMFQSWKLDVSGKLMSDVIIIKCTNSLLPPESIQFESFLQDYTPKSVACPMIPSDIGLPQLTVSNIQIQVEVKEDTKTFSLTNSISNVWKFTFGDKFMQVEKITGSLEWVKQYNNAPAYKAVLYGTLKLNSVSVSASMHLGNNIDSILVAEISNVRYGQIANYLTSQPFVSSSLVPQNVQGINSPTACLAFNVTKKHFFLSGSVDNWGKCTLFVGYIHDQNDTDYIIMVSIGDCFRFSQLSGSLAFVDEYITLQYVNLLMSSVDTDTLKTVMKPFEEASLQDMSKIQNPFSTLPDLDSSKLINDVVKKGTTLYAILNIHSCRGTLRNLSQLGDQSLAQNNIIVKVYIENLSNLEVFAYLPNIHLCGMLYFSMIEMSYKVTQKDKDTSPEYFLVLTGRITFGLELEANHDQSVSFDGKLCITPTDAKCQDTSSKGTVKEPGDMNITVEELTLDFRFEFCEDEGTQLPDVKINGKAYIDSHKLETMLLLKGTSFKVIKITLKHGLTLDSLFKCSNIGWTDLSLSVVIKEGTFYYAKENISIKDDNQMVVDYKKGFFLTCIFSLFEWDFRIEAHVPSDDRSKLSFSGRSVKKIDLVFAKLTGTDKYINKGPEIRYRDKMLSLHVGIELFNEPYFKGHLDYRISENSFEGPITYLGKILWIQDPEVTVYWSRYSGFQIKKFIIPNLHIGFNLLRAIKACNFVLYKLITGIFSWGIQFHLRTDKNPDPERYIVKLILGGDITVSVAGYFTNKLIPLPEIPLRIAKKKGFTLKQLPVYILECLWESAGDICKSLLCYINPINLVKNIAKNIKEIIVTTTKTVVNVVKNVVKKTYSSLKKLFGFSAFLIDSIQNTVLGYIEDVRNGRKLYNIRYTVDNFGEFLVAHTIEKIAKDVHTNATTCTMMQVEEKNKYSDDLDELQEVTQTLSSELNLAAHKVLTVKYITAECRDNVFCVKWQVGNSEGKIYSEDRGDIEYYVKVIVIMVQVETQMVSVCKKEIYNDILTPVYPRIQERNKDDLNNQFETSRASEVIQKEAMHEDQQSPTASSSGSIINQFHEEHHHEEQMEQGELTANKNEMHHTQLAEDAMK